MPKRITVERIREAVHIRVQATSLRAVARQVGMSPGGLYKFVRGGIPYQKSRRKLYNWLRRERRNLGSGYTADAMAGAMVSLVQDLPVEGRDPALRRLLALLSELYEARPPKWIVELARAADEGVAFPDDEVPHVPNGTDPEDANEE